MTIVGTAGHVDHGKSSLVRALTGIDPDRWDEERRRGVTIDVGFAHTTLPGGTVLSLVDVPGHVRFIANMLAGAGAIDAVIFVVDAQEGWKPQSEEHLRILELLGVREGVIALTKCDLVDDEWRELQRMEVAEHLAGTFLASAPMVDVSAVTGVGLDELVREVEAMVRRCVAPATDGRSRLWIDRSFAITGAGCVVTGALTGAALELDERVDVLPRGVVGRVRGLQVHGVAVERAQPGSRVAVNLGGVDHLGVHRGDALVHAAKWYPTRRVDASLRALASLDHEVSRRGAYAVFIGSGEFTAKVRVLGPDTLAPGEDGFVRLHLPVELPLAPGDRFVLRESGRSETVGGGEILDVAPVRRASRAAPTRSVQRVVDERGWVSVDDLAAMTGERRAATAGEWVMSDDFLAAVRADLDRRVRAGGSTGLDLATLDERERAVARATPAWRIADGRLLPAEARDDLADHPVVAMLEAAGASPPATDGVDRGVLRALVRRGVLWECDGIFFHGRAIELATAAVRELVAEHPEGFTVGDLRDALGITRKHAVPIAAELDARAITRRRGDLRIAGARLSPMSDVGNGDPQP